MSKTTSVFANRKTQLILGQSITYAFLIMGSVLVLIPFFWMLSTALKDLPETLAYPPKWLPQVPQFRNFWEGLTILPFGTFFFNSSVVTFLSVLGLLLSTTVVAYGFARLRGPGSDVLFIMVLATMMIPSQVTLIPQYVLFSRLRWINTFLPLTVPNFFAEGAAGAFFIFMLRQFFMGIPVELDESARIDGCGYLRILWHIILPLSRPAITSVIIFSFMSNWKELLLPLIYLNSTSKFTVPIGLSMFQSMYQVQPLWNYLMAVSVVSLVPCLVVFFWGQRYFVEGMVTSGLKG